MSVHVICSSAEKFVSLPAAPAYKHSLFALNTALLTVLPIRIRRTSSKESASSLVFCGVMLAVAAPEQIN